MLVQDRYLKISKYPRLGVLKNLVVPTGATVPLKKLELNILDKEKSLKLVGGKGSFVIADEIGICELSEIRLIFLKDVMLVEVVKGYIYIRNSDGSIKVISSKNKIGEVNKSIERIDWKSYNDMFKYCNFIAINRYNLINENDIFMYTHNLFFNIKMSYYFHDNKLFSFTMLGISEILGLDLFNFEKKEKIEMGIMGNKYYDSKEEKEEKYLENSKNTITLKNSKKKSTSNSDELVEDEEDEEEEVLPVHMHEIDIFNEYTPDYAED